MIWPNNNVAQILQQVGVCFLKIIIFYCLFLCGVVWLCCSTFPSFPDARKLHIEGAKWKVNCLSISIMHVEKGGDGGQKFWSAGNWRRFRNFDLSLYHKKDIHGMYPPIMILFDTVWFSNCVTHLRGFIHIYCSTTILSTM